MKVYKRFLLLVLMMFLSTYVYADGLSETVNFSQVLESNSEIKYGPFSTGDSEPETFKKGIRLYSTESLDIAYNYEELKSSIYSHMKNYENSFSINYKGDTSTLEVDINRMWDEIFEEDDYLYGVIKTYGAYSSRGYTNDVTINFTSFTYHTNKEQEEFVDARVSEIIDEIVQHNMTDFQKVKAINDWIVNNTKYDEYTNTSPHSAYTLFNEGKGVCQAYAMATYRLLEKTGIEAKYVTGKVGSENHGWNLVKVDGKWYHLDTTWNDPVYSDGSDVLSYNYFLISDDAISEDHKIDDRIYPSAIDTKYEVMRGIQNPVELGNCMYYINDISENDYKLYKLNLDTMEKTKLTDDNVQYIAGYEDWIYYSNYSRGGYLYKIKTDGTENTELNNVDSEDVYIELPYIHYYDNTNRIWDKIEVALTDVYDSYEQWKDILTTKSSNYTWTIKLNMPINNATVNNSVVYIIDENYNKLSFINTSVKNDGGFGYIKLNNNGSFQRNKNYWIIIEDAVKSQNGKKLNKGLKVQFNVQ